MRGTLVVASAAACILAVACGGGEHDAAGDTQAPTPVEERLALPTLAMGSGGATPAPGVIDRVVAQLAADLGVSAAGIVVVSLEPRTWPDGCLGLARPGQACTQALVPGWLAVLRAPDGKEYRFRGASNRFEREP